MKRISLVIFFSWIFLVSSSVSASAEDKIYTDTDLQRYDYGTPDEETTKMLRNNLKKWEQDKTDKEQKAREQYLREQQRRAQQIKQRPPEQRVVTIYSQATWGGSASFLETDCRSLCFSSGDINDYLRDGWRVIGTNYAQREERPFKSNSGWCRCTGTEYILQR